MQTISKPKYNFYLEQQWQQEHQSQNQWEKSVNTAPAIQQTLREEKQNYKSNKNKDERNQSQSFMKKGDRNYK